MNLSQIKASQEESELKAKDASDQENDQKVSDLTSKLDEKESEISRLATENEEHVKRVAELTAYIQQTSQDREQIIQQYTSYSQQLATQIETLTQQLHAKALENTNFSSRESDLLAHVERLENQLQNSMKTSSISIGTNDASSMNTASEMSILRSQAANLDEKVLSFQLERDQLQESLKKVVSDEKSHLLFLFNYACFVTGGRLGQFKAKMLRFRKSCPRARN